MLDFYFISAVVNMFWQIFTILFVLYRFTSFFTMIYNFFLFLGKLLKGVIYIKDQISLYIIKKKNYSYLSNDEIHNTPRTPWFTKIKNFFTRNSPTPTPNIPLYETRTSYIHNLHMSSNFRINNNDKNDSNDNNNNNNNSNNNNSNNDNNNNNNQDTNNQNYGTDPLNIHTNTNSNSPSVSRTDIDFENYMQNMMNSSNYESTEFYNKTNLNSTQVQPTYISLTTDENDSNSSSNITKKNESNGSGDGGGVIQSNFLTRILNALSSDEQSLNYNTYNTHDTDKTGNKDLFDNLDKDEELKQVLLDSEYDT